MSHRRKSRLVFLAGPREAVVLLNSAFGAIDAPQACGKKCVCVCVWAWLKPFSLELNGLIRVRPFVCLPLCHGGGSCTLWELEGWRPQQGAPRREARDWSALAPSRLPGREEPSRCW